MADEEMARLRDQAREFGSDYWHDQPRFGSVVNHVPVYATGPDGAERVTGEVRRWSVVDALWNVRHGEPARFDSREAAETEANRLNGQWRRALRLEGKEVES